MARPHTRLYYQIVLGTVDQEAAVAKLMATYADTRVERHNARGEAVLAVILVDRDGRPIEAPATAISSFGWAVPRALAGELDTLGAWAEVEKRLVEGLDRVIRQEDSNGDLQALDAASIHNAYHWPVSTLGLSADVVQPPAFAIRSYEYFKNPEPPESLLLNSFFLMDLAMTAYHFRQNMATANLRRYLGAVRPETRRDLLHDRGALASAVRPALFSPARWPGPGRHPLVLLQQAAVNLASQELRESGILAVNGPPGTGKTTLLRDIVAGLVAERARIMAGFDDPEDAFAHLGAKLRAGNAWIHLYEEQAPCDHEEALQRWGQARKSFTSALNRSEALLRDLETIRTLAERLSELVASELQARDRLQVAVANEAQAAALSRDAEQTLANEECWRDAAAADRQQHVTGRPSFFARLFRTTRLRAWHEADVGKCAVMQQAAEAFERAMMLAADASKRLEQAMAAKAKAAAELKSASEQRSEAAQVGGAAREQLGARFVDHTFFERDHEETHQLSPWLDAAAHRVRDDVFVAAIALHKAFIDAAAKPLRHNLGCPHGHFQRPCPVGCRKEKLTVRPMGFVVPGGPGGIDHFRLGRADARKAPSGGAGLVADRRGRSSAPAGCCGSLDADEACGRGRGSPANRTSGGPA
jgi:hypothetical protein